MNGKWIASVFATYWSISAGLVAQEQPPSPPPTALTRVEAKKEVVVNWTLGDQSWSFKEVLMTYEPVRGYLEPGVDPAGRPGTLAVWKLRTAKDMEEGTVRLHEQMRGSPFKVVLLDEDRLVVNPDAPAQITLPSGRAGDTLELRVALPDAEQLKQVKAIRVERRTDVGF
jgi:hypothetical protein